MEYYQIKFSSKEKCLWIAKSAKKTDSFCNAFQTSFKEIQESLIAS